ncbi:MAG: hypothetical protein V1662_05985 [Candidatus Omnitrophota bacterium]
MSREDIKDIKVDHIVDSPEYSFICVTINQRVRNFRVFKDGRVEIYDRGHFVPLTQDFARDINSLIGCIQDIPTFCVHSAL